MTIGVKLGDKIGPRFATLIGISVMYISYVIMIFFTNYYLILIAMGIFGLGDGIANLSVIKNCWKYFPNNTASVNGIIIGGLGLSSAVLTPIADYLIINPNRKAPNIDGIYSEDIANNLLKFLYFLLILFLILGILAVSFTFKYEVETILEGKIEIQENELNKINKDSSNLSILCEGFCSFTNVSLSLFCFCGPCKYN